MTRRLPPRGPDRDRRPRARRLLEQLGHRGRTRGARIAGARRRRAAGVRRRGSACSVGEGTGTPAEIKNFAFPTGLSVTAGQAIAWTNGDTANHTVTFDDGSCNTPVDSGADGRS